MSAYTLTTELMREWHVRGDHAGNKSRSEYEAEFDRWLEAHDREVTARALHLAADRLPAFHDRNAPEWAITSTFKWLHERADRIEAGGFDD